VAADFQTVITNREDVVFRSADTTAFVASHQWPDNAGHVLVVPNEHYENLYLLPISLADPLQRTTQLIARAIKLAFDCPGISTRQHNEPAGGQDVWHYHVHVFPRYDEDGLYGAERRAVAAAERKSQAQMIRDALNALN
jgi:histidine triad (HIT) family protein